MMFCTWGLPGRAVMVKVSMPWAMAPGPDGAESRRDLRAADQWVGNPRLIWDSLGSGQRRVTTLRRV